MPQSIHFRGYKVSGFAVKVDSDWSNAWYLIEKDGKFVRKWTFVVPIRSVGAAEAAAVLHGAKAIEEWTADA
jgi:hypothetical protein